MMDARQEIDADRFGDFFNCFLISGRLKASQDSYNNVSYCFLGTKHGANRRELSFRLEHPWGEKKDNQGLNYSWHNIIIYENKNNKDMMQNLKSKIDTHASHGDLFIITVARVRAIRYENKKTVFLKMDDYKNAHVSPTRVQYENTPGSWVDGGEIKHHWVYMPNIALQNIKHLKLYHSYENYLGAKQQCKPIITKAFDSIFNNVDICSPDPSKYKQQNNTRVSTPMVAQPTINPPNVPPQQPVGPQPVHVPPVVQPAPAPQQPVGPQPQQDGFDEFGEIPY